MKKFNGSPAKPVVPPGANSKKDKKDKMVLDAPGLAQRHSPMNPPPANVAEAGAGSFEHNIEILPPNGIYIHDLEKAATTFINPQYTRLTGYTLADFQIMKGAEFFALFHPEDQERIAAHLERIGRAGDDETLEIEYRFKTADGRWICCLSRDAVFERDGHGCVRRIIGTCMEITQRKIGEPDLKKARHTLETKIRKRTAQLEATVKALESEMQLREDLENQMRQWSRVFMDAADPIIIENLSGLIIDMNREAEREYGWKRHELIGKSILNLIPAARYQWAEQLRQRCRRGEEVRNWEDMRQDRSGRTFSVLVTAFPLLDESGKIVSVATIVKDITKRKQMEKKLKISRQYLQNLSRKSIEALENDRRTTAKELHDGIGVSLAFIKFRLESIVDDVVKDPEKAAASLDETITYLQAAIKDIKQISAGLRPIMLDDLGLLSTITWYTRHFVKQFDVQLTPQIEVQEDEIPEILKIVIFRVLQEALHNAVKHGRATAISVGLNGDADRIALEVADNGCGFYVQEILRRQDPLSGYGLASMQQHAEIVGGSLTIDSLTGKGTRIRMTLPFSASEALL
jgi:PAS domain S-box-containing protein